MGLWKGIFNMPQETVQMDITGTKYLCDLCGVGYMAAIDKRFVNEGETLFPHECNNCGSKVNYSVSYPLINYNGL